MGFGMNTNCLEACSMSITIQLVGSASAIFGVYRYTARGNGHDPIRPSSAVSSPKRSSTLMCS
jgi:hypothetical protein